MHFNAQYAFLGYTRSEMEDFFFLAAKNGVIHQGRGLYTRHYSTRALYKRGYTRDLQYCNASRMAPQGYTGGQKTKITWKMCSCPGKNPVITWRHFATKNGGYARGITVTRPGFSYLLVLVALPSSMRKKTQCPSWVFFFKLKAPPASTYASANNMDLQPWAHI